MKVISDTLEPQVEHWDDPGDYPNNCAQGPLPSQDYFTGVGGEVVLELTDAELADYAECPEDFLDDLDIELPAGILSIDWKQSALVGKLLTLYAQNAEPDPSYHVGEDDRDYDDYDRDDYDYP